MRGILKSKLKVGDLVRHIAAGRTDRYVMGLVLDDVTDRESRYNPMFMGEPGIVLVQWMLDTGERREELSYAENLETVESTNND